MEIESAWARYPDCRPFKGMADYWNLTAVEPVEKKNLVWAFREEVAGIKGYVAVVELRHDGTPPRPSSKPRRPSSVVVSHRVSSVLRAPALP